MDELERFEFLSLVSAVQREMMNHIGMDDKVLAEFLISLHDESADLKEFRSKLAESGSEFPDSLISSIDRLVLTLHPKYKKKASASAPAANGNAKSSSNKEGAAALLDAEAQKQRKLFPGLSMPDSDWRPSYESDETAGKIKVEGMVDDLMSQLEGVEKRHRGGEDQGQGSSAAGAKRKRSISPPAVRRRSPDYDSSSRYGARGMGGSSSSNGAGGYGGRPQLDSAPVVYKIYDGRVTGIKDFGAFVSLQGIAGRAEGMFICMHCALPKTKSIDTFLNRHGSCRPDFYGSRQPPLRHAEQRPACESQSDVSRWKPDWPLYERCGSGHGSGLDAPPSHHV